MTATDATRRYDTPKHLERLVKTKWEWFTKKSAAGIEYQDCKLVAIPPLPPREKNRYGRRQEMKKMLRIVKKMKQNG